MNTCPDKTIAMEIAEQLITAKLAACVNIMPAGISVYRWEGKVETAEEVLLLIKTHEDKYAELEITLQKLHPYELPEIVAVPIVNGSSDYLGWLSENVDL